MASKSLESSFHCKMHCEVPSPFERLCTIEEGASERGERGSTFAEFEFVDSGHSIWSRFLDERNLLITENFYRAFR